MTKMTGDGTRAQNFLQSWENQKRLGTTTTSLGIPRIVFACYRSCAGVEWFCWIHIRWKHSITQYKCHVDRSLMLAIPCASISLSLLGITSNFRNPARQPLKNPPIRLHLVKPIWLLDSNVVGQQYSTWTSPTMSIVLAGVKPPTASIFMW